MAASPADRLDGLFKLRKADGWVRPTAASVPMENEKNHPVHVHNIPTRGTLYPFSLWIVSIDSEKSFHARKWLQERSRDSLKFFEIWYFEETEHFRDIGVKLKNSHEILRKYRPFITPGLRCSSPIWPDVHVATRCGCPNLRERWEQ